MSKSLKLLACALYITFATAACHPNVQTHDNSVSPPPKEEGKVKLIGMGGVPNTAYTLLEYEVQYDTNRVVRCISLKHASHNRYFEQNSLTCDWGRSRWDGIH